MSTHKIEDYLTKQLFISKNIVTYRLLSREFGIHVNVAKNELAAFYAKSTQSPERACSATYLISGEYVSPPHSSPPSAAGANTTNNKSQDSTGNSGDMDVDMDRSPSPSFNAFSPTSTPRIPRIQDYGFATGSDQYEGDVVMQIRLTVVPEAGLEEAKAKYANVNSVHVYSLSPAPIRDADLLCEHARKIREIDSQKGMEMAKVVGRIIGEGIEMKAGGVKAKSRLTATSAAAPKLRVGTSASTSATVAPVKVEEKTAKEPAKEESKKPKQTGKLNFFAPKAQAKEKGKDGSSKNSGATEAKGKMFFGAASSSKSSAPLAKEKEKAQPPASPPYRPKEDKLKDIEPKRGIKRKSTTAILSDEEEEEADSAKSNSAAPSGTPSRRSSNPPSTRSSPQPTRAPSRLRLHKNAVLSDDEDDDEQPRKKIVKKPRRKTTYVSDDEDGHDPEASKEAARALKSMMEINDDQVEKVSRRAKVEPTRKEEEEETEPEREAPFINNEDEDVDMSDDTNIKPKPKPRRKKEKKVVPVGRNGLKKRRVMKSRMRVDEKGYMVTEDYSSYESVGEEEEEEEEPKKAVSAKKGNGRKRAAGSKQEKEDDTESAAPEDPAVNAATKNSETRSKPNAKAAASSTKSSLNRSMSTKSGQKQKTLNTFFGPPKAKK
ncbi:hypothetical protein AN958_07030 [Leucoagaricus sp. SymC.cos]|nr:hypothetical protein AN958_07030 [Leucoagaricus sp. SymC.cos]